MFKIKLFNYASVNKVIIFLFAMFYKQLTSRSSFEIIVDQKKLE